MVDAFTVRKREEGLDTSGHECYLLFLNVRLISNMLLYLITYVITVNHTYTLNKTYWNILRNMQCQTNCPCSKTYNAGSRFPLLPEHQCNFLFRLLCCHIASKISFQRNFFRWCHIASVPAHSERAIGSRYGAPDQDHRPCVHGTAAGACTAADVCRYKWQFWLKCCKCHIKVLGVFMVAWIFGFDNFLMSPKCFSNVCYVYVMLYSFIIENQEITYFLWSLKRLFILSVIQ